MERFVLTSLGIYLALVLLNRALLLQRLLRLRMPMPWGIAVDDDMVPASERRIFEPVTAWLQSEGFAPLGTAHFSPILLGNGTDHRTARYFLSHDRLTVAVVTLATLPENGRSYSLLFISDASNGHRVFTMNRQADGAYDWPPQYLVQDGYADDASQLALHRQALTVFAASPYEDLEDALERGRGFDATTVAYWQAQGLMQQEADELRLTLRGAWQTLSRARRHRQRLRAAPPVAAEPLPPEMLRAGEQAFLQQQLALQRAIDKPQGRGRKILVFLATLAAFLVLGGLQFSMTTLAMLTVVLVIHELGHYLAMRIVGYRDVSIFFVPLLGAATTGRHDRASPWQQLAVFLAGPVPGLLLALGVIVALALPASPLLAWLPPSAYQPLRVLLALLVVINYLNLLPISPFDGGRIVETLYLSRRPHALFWFHLLCTLAFAGAWKASADPVLLVLAIVMAIGLPLRWQLAQASRHLQDEFGRHDSEESALAAVAQVCTEPHMQQLPPARRLALARQLLPQLQARPASRRTAAAGTALYLALLGLPFAVFLPAFGSANPLPGLKHLLQADPDVVETRELEAALRAATAPQDRLRATIDLARQLQYSDSDNSDHRFRELARSAVRDIPPALAHSPLAAEARLLHVDTIEDDPEKTERALADAYAQLPPTSPEARSLLADIQERRERNLPDTASAARRLQFLSEAYDLRRAADDDYSRIDTGLHLARESYLAGDGARTGVVLDELKQLTLKADFQIWRSQVAEARAWHQLNEVHPAAAIEELRPVQDDSVETPQTASVPRTLAWAQLVGGQGDSAVATLARARKALLPRIDREHRYLRQEMAFLLLDELLVQTQSGKADVTAPREAFLRYVLEARISGDGMARQARYEAESREWRSPMARAELQLLEELGFTAEAQCHPGNSSDDKDSAPANAVTPPARP